MRGARFAVIAGAALVVGTVMPASSMGAVTCSYNGGPKHLEVLVSSEAKVVRKASSIEVYSVSGSISTSVGCSGGGATVSNTDAIVIQDMGGGAFVTTIDLSGGLFAPGATPETGLTDEIEFQLNGVEFPQVFGSPGVDNVRFGTAGVNLNAGGEGVFTGGIDSDVTLGGATRMYVRGEGGNDLIQGHGGVGTGSPFPPPMTIFGGVGDDELIGGGGDDQIGYQGLSSDEAGNDTIGGGGGADRLSAAPGNDLISGGGAEDAATYYDAPSGVSIDLSVGGQQNTGGGGVDSLSEVEIVEAGSFDDTLLGDASANRLEGGGGSDTIDGRGGVDTLLGEFGGDALITRDGGPDTASCGPETDTVTADLAGTDTIDPDCETVEFAAFVPPPDGGGGGGGGGDGGGGGSDTTVDVNLAAKRKQDAVAQKGLVVSASCPEESCDVTARGSIRTPKPPGRSARAKVRPVKLRAVSESLPAGVTEELGLQLPKKGAKRTSAALDRHPRLPAVVRVAASDAAGNQATASVKIKVVD